MRAVILLAVCLTLAAAYPKNPQRIVGGSVTTIDRYPYGVAMLYVWFNVNMQSCGAIVINNRSALSAAHCYDGDRASDWRLRVGSTFANSGGFVHNVNLIIMHPYYIPYIYDSDVAIIRSSTPFTYSDYVQPASIAGPNYNVADNQQVWAIGWGTTSWGGPLSEQLREVQVWTVNQDVCRERYAPLDYPVTENMMCSGWLDVGGRDQCQGDSGGPLIHNNVVVGICSWGERCALARYPGVNARVSRFTSWIQANA